MGAYQKPRGQQLTASQAAFNAEMTKERVSVEHAFGFVQKYWTQSAFHLANHVGSSPVAAYYLAACLFSNIMVCLRGNQVSQQFNCSPPSLDEYFAGMLAAEAGAEDAEVENARIENVRVENVGVENAAEPENTR